MVDEGTLTKKAREAIQARKLPNGPPTRMSAGNGFGTGCPICDNLVQPDEIGYEVEFAASEESAARKVYHIHARCFAAWETERHAALGQTGRPVNP